MSYLIDYIAELGLDAGKDFLSEKYSQKELKKRIKEYVKRQSNIHELSSLTEEIDFEDLAEYMKSGLLEDIQKRLFGVKKDERKAAREQIFQKSIMYSGAKTDIAKKKVVKIVSNIIDILHRFYFSKVGKGAVLVLAEVEDVMEDGFDKVSRKIDNTLEKNSLVSIDSAIKAISSGELKEVENKINTFFDCISVVHELSPDYKFVPEVDSSGKVRIFSKAVSTDALKKYPPQIKCKGTIKVGDRYLRELDLNIFQYANRHQLPITMEVQQAKKYLGTVEDPVQYEAVSLIGQELVIPPKPFPEAKAYKLYINDYVEFDYLLLRVQEIEDDETIVVTNKEQVNCPFKFRFRINLKNRTLRFTISKEGLNNSELLEYTKFIAKVHEGTMLRLKALEGNGEIECPLNNLDYSSDFSTIENEIEFLKKVVTIEKYFDKSIVLPEEIYFKDYEVISYMADLINGKEVERGWTEAAFSFDLCNSTKNSILNMKIKFFISAIRRL